MITATARTITEWTGGTLQGNSEAAIRGVSRDSRKISAENLYLPLIGERFDGHSFAKDVADQGVRVMLWQEDHPLPDLGPDFTYILVKDTLAALQDLAKSYRETLKCKVIGVTGSNGKTSTKDMIAAVLSSKYQVQKTAGNLNNHIGLPLMLLELSPDTEVAVLEMGMSARGEIALLASLAKPDFGIITNIGESHLEYLGSREGIAEAKFELIEQLTSDGWAFLNGDEPLLRQLAPKSMANVVFFGLTPETNEIYPVQFNTLGMEGTDFSLPDSSVLFHLPIPGSHQLSNALAALGVARKLGCSDEECKKSLLTARLSAMRTEVYPGVFGGKVINDAYNASPSSMKAAIQTLVDSGEPGLKVAILGDMLELGDESARFHFEIGKFAAERGIDLLLAVGQFSGHMEEGAFEGGMNTHWVHRFDDALQAAEWAVEYLTRTVDPIVLVKGSRGMKMERVAERLIAAKS